MTPALRGAIDHVKLVIATEDRINLFGRFVQNVGYLIEVAEATENLKVSLTINDKYGVPLVEKHWQAGDAK